MKRAWRTSLVVLACSIGVLTAMYWETAMTLLVQWRTSTYSHQMFVLPVAAFLAWKRRERVRDLEPSPSWWVLLFLPALAFVWLLGDLTRTAVVEHFCFVAMIVVLIWGQIGSRAARALAVPLLFLFFMVPAGDSLIPYLQDYAAWFAVKALEFSRVPVLLEGRIITIPSGRWEVAEACSGIHYLLASLTIGFVYADLTFLSWIRKGIFLLASFLVPILANGIRVYGIVLTDYLGGTHLARSADHVIAGFIFLTVIMLFLFAVGMKWKEDTRERAHERKAPAPNSPHEPLTKVLGFAVLGLLLLEAGPAYARSSLGEDTIPGSLILRAPAVALPWAPSGARIRGWQPGLLAPDGEFVQSYVKDSRLVELRIAYYGASGKDTKMISSSNPLYDGSWERTGGESIKATLEGREATLREVSIRSGNQQLLLWNCYWVDGTITSSPYRAKWLLAWAKLRRSSAGSAVVLMVTEENLADGPTAGVLRDFTQHLTLPETFRRLN